MTSNIITTLANELNVKTWQIEATIRLIDEGNTIPFIARYRKEATGSLNDETLRLLDDRLAYLRNLDERKNQVIAAIEEQGKLTDELRKKIEESSTLVAVEDLYLPYRPKKRTRATIAKEKGLEPLADYIFAQERGCSVRTEAEKYINIDKEVVSAQDAITGAMDILAERISDNAAFRSYIRTFTFNNGKILSSAKDKETESVYEMYYEFEEAVKKIAGHRILAINRGEKEKFLSVKIDVSEDDIVSYLVQKNIKHTNTEADEIISEAVKDSYKRLIAPAIERDIRNELTENAEDSAIKVFGRNLTQLLMQPPITGQVVLGWDPAFRTGCKLAVVDSTGKVLDTVVIYPRPLRIKWKKLRKRY